MDVGCAAFGGGKTPKGGGAEGGGPAPTVGEKCTFFVEVLSFLCLPAPEPFVRALSVEPLLLLLPSRVCVEAWPPRVLPASGEEVQAPC
jgi:hypothetical protein